MLVLIKAALIKIALVKLMTKNKSGNALRPALILKMVIEMRSCPSQTWITAVTAQSANGVYHCDWYVGAMLLSP